jgi:hypothetical protein
MCVKDFRYNSYQQVWPMLTPCLCTALAGERTLSPEELAAKEAARLAALEKERWVVGWQQQHEGVHVGLKACKVLSRKHGAEHWQAAQSVLPQDCMQNADTRHLRD